ncbi:glutamate receptor 2-like isoform X1 [Nematostella vectensis]|nr:glutamate receptor 2-like isoform X1 [Nematostella vectensis]
MTTIRFTRHIRIACTVWHQVLYYNLREGLQFRTMFSKISQYIFMFVTHYTATQHTTTDRHLHNVIITIIIYLAIISNSFEGAEKLLKQINIQLSPVGDQANTEFIINKLLPFGQGVENVGMVAGGKVEMFDNLLRPKLKCKDPNALCVVVILDVLCYKSVYEVESSKECILSHMCTMFSHEMDDDNATITRAKHFCCKGFVIDILISLERDLDFKAEVYIVEDGKYGVYDRNSKRWYGMIGDLIDGKAELALTSLELSLAREEVVDFSNVPFIYHDRVIVMAVKSSYTSHDWFGFTKPFSTSLWITFGAASVILVIVVWIIDKYSPYGHKHHFQVFTLRDSFSYLSSTVFKINLDDVTAGTPQCKVYLCRVLLWDSGFNFYLHRKSNGVLDGSKSYISNNGYT